MRNAFGIIKLLVFLGYLLVGLGIAAILRWTKGRFWFADPQGARVKRVWIRGAAAILGLRWTVHGAHPRADAVWVANHISWLDAVALSAIRPVTFIAKADVRRWPVIGQLIGLSGTLFIDRNRRQDVAAQLSEARCLLARGVGIAFFPEGTTSRGDRVLPFKPALFALVDGKVPLQSIALRYRPAASGRDYAPFVDDISFADHLWQVLTAPGGIVLDVFFREPEQAHDLPRKMLAAQTEECVRNQVLRLSAPDLQDENMGNEAPTLPLASIND